LNSDLILEPDIFLLIVSDSNSRDSLLHWWYEAENNRVYYEHYTELLQIMPASEAYQYSILEIRKFPCDIKIHTLLKSS